MKKITLALAVTFISMASIAQNSYTIKGTAPVEYNGKQVYLYNYNGSKNIDSTTIADGTFVLKNSIVEPEICRLAVAGTYSSIDLIVENLPSEVDFSQSGIATIKADAGYNAKYAKIANYQAQLSTRADVIIDSLKVIYADDQDAMAEVFTDLLNPEVENLLAIYQTDMKANADNVYGLLCAWIMSQQTVENLAQLDSLIAIVPSAKEFAPIQKQREQLELVDAVGPGTMFKDFAAKTVDGKATKLSDYVGKGKYVLVDFWASWCGPCMREVPNIKFLHETYPDLVVVGVNVWDKHDKFLDAIKKEDMTWTCLYASDNKTATELYGIQGIPTIILFAPDGKIVDRTLRGEAMKNYIANLFK